MPDIFHYVGTDRKDKPVTVRRLTQLLASHIIARELDNNGEGKNYGEDKRGIGLLWL